MNPTPMLATAKEILPENTFSHLMKVQEYVDDLEQKLAEKDREILRLRGVREVDRALSRKKLEF